MTIINTVAIVTAQVLYIKKKKKTQEKEIFKVEKKVKCNSREVHSHNWGELIIIYYI